jgi:hypothetical protein
MAIHLRRRSPTCDLDLEDFVPAIVVQAACEIFSVTDDAVEGAGEAVTLGAHDPRHDEDGNHSWIYPSGSPLGGARAHVGTTW